MKRLQHPHIVALLDCHETTNEIHLVMEYCGLGDLAIFIKRRDSLAKHPWTQDMIAKYPNPPGGGLNEVIVRHFIKQLASALQFLRDRDLVHRDVKPQNLLLNPSPVMFAKGIYKILPYKRSDYSLTPLAGVDSLPMLKIADFGFARSLPSTSLAETLCGSPLYMAPEILAYRKYDAKADLWSVGTVVYEMVAGKAPFRAHNHIQLLERINQAEDNIRFPTNCEASEDMRRVIRGLLKRNSVERMTFTEFFDSPIVKNEIPGLVPEDREYVAGRENLEAVPDLVPNAPSLRQDQEEMAAEAATNYSSSSPRQETHHPTSSKQPSSAVPRSPDSPMRRVGSRERHDLQRAAVTARRPSLVNDKSPSPPQPDSHERTSGGVVMERQRSRNTASPGSSFLKERVTEDQAASPRQRKYPERTQEHQSERAAQDVAFERDYVVVEKRAVEVNAFADELAASPRITQQRNQSPSRHPGTIVRRTTTSAIPQSPKTGQGQATKALQAVPGRPRADSSHQRQNSYERRYGPTSATSAISKALNMASGRLFGVGFSPPLALGRGGRSPPLGYNPFPAYPAANDSLVLVGEGGKTNAALNEDTKMVQIIEECATRSDVVYGFAEVKYKQLVPLTPAMQRETVAQHQDTADDVPESPDGGLTVDAMVTLSEEALVLYVKALGLLAKSMDIAGAWWTRKNRGEVLGDIASRPESKSNAALAATRINNVVQWVRSRFNEVLEKAEYVRMKLSECQKQLPLDHPSHPNNYTVDPNLGGSFGSSVDHIVVSSGITAEKLMYDRALEMSRSAAINELTGEDLPGCEIAYVTAIRMLEAVLDGDEEDDYQQNKTPADINEEQSDQENGASNVVQNEDRRVVMKRKLLHHIQVVFMFLL